MESGDLSPLAPLNLRDLIWLRAARDLKRKNDWKEEEARLKLTAEYEKQRNLLLMDIREIGFRSLGYPDNISAQRGWYSLPTMKEAGLSPEIVYGKSHGVKKLLEQEGKKTGE